jgi:hypothetical protein
MKRSSRPRSALVVPVLLRHAALATPTLGQETIFMEGSDDLALTAA